MKTIQLYKTYNKVRDVFEKPILKWKFGKWKHDHCLPIWRRGNTIHFGKYAERNDEYDYARLVESKWNEFGKKNHPILSKILKPTYVLPMWLSFYIFNHDVIWKTKFDDYRYEFPPQFTIVFFGYSLSFWLRNPTDDVSKDDDYWEAILWYLEKKDLSEVDEELGDIVHHWGKKNEYKEKRLNKKFLK